MPKSDDNFLKEARERFKKCEADEADIRSEALKDLQFVAGDQWDPKIKQDREKYNRPALTFNRLATFVQLVANEARQSKSQIKFQPVEDADQDTAEVYEGLARHIQYSSDAEEAYETAFEYATGGSFGYFGFLNPYCDDDSFDTELAVRTIVDPFAVYGVLTPACFGREPRYAFVVDDMPLEEYKALYPKSKAVSMGFEEASKDASGWVGTETIRIAEYWTVEDKTSVIALLADGSVVEADEVPEGENIVKSRQVTRPVVKFCKINGIEILDGSEADWPGSKIPIVPVLGKKLILKGKPVLYSVVRFQRDPQQLINYAKTRIAESLATSPISPFVAVEGQISGHEKEWQTANTTLRPYLEYRAVSIGGQPAPPPQRQTFEPPIAALSTFVGMEVDDLKAISGIFDASLGNQAREVSGLAIARRQQQSSSTNMHFRDNLERAFKKGGEIIAEVIPKIYDTPRTIRILGADETPKIVKVNQMYRDEAGRTRNYDLTAGKYDLVVTVGQTYSTKRMESFDMMSQIIQGNPQLLATIGDIFFRNSDVAGANQLADRFKKMLPPQLQDDPGADPKQQAVAMQSQLQALSQQHDALVQALNVANETIKTKAVENQGKLDIERLRIEGQIAIAEIQTKAQQIVTRAKLEQDMWAQLHSSAHDTAMQAVGNQQAVQQQAQQQPQEQTA